MVGMWLSCQWGAPPPPRVGPDVLVVTVDTLRADRLGFAGHDDARTPALDALAARGRTFTQAITPLPRTTPALASLLTGQAPHRHGSREVAVPLDEDVDTLATLLSRRGWATAAVSAMRVASPEQGFDRGFGSFLVAHDAPAATIAGMAERHLSIDASLFLWVHFADPHFPYTPYGGDSACAQLEKLGERIGRAAVFSNRDGHAADALPDCKRRYDEEIARVDEAIGSLLAQFEARPGDGVVVFTADHGEHLGEEKLYYEHGPTVHDANLRVPFVVAGPGVAQGRDRGVFSLIDVVPSLLSLIGEDVPGGLDGEDLSARWRGAKPEDGRRFAESGSALQVRLFESLVSGRTFHWCLNEGNFSLCHRKRWKDGPRLYRHDRDPAMKHDVSSAYPGVRQRLVAAAERWPPESARERTVRTSRYKLVARPTVEGYATTLYDLTLPGVDVTASFPEVAAELTAALDAWVAPRPTAFERDEATLEALRSLGYVE